MKRFLLIMIFLLIILSFSTKKNITKINIKNIYLEANNTTLVDYLKNKANDKNIQEYENGNKNEMYVFEHTDTDQMNANIDYRYIGNEPNNYIYFNCTDDNETNSCEIWRIIGIFEVEDENGNKEERIKIIRNNSIGKLPFDENYSNNYSNSTLKAYLNEGEYYNSINEKYKDMIATTKYYLGGLNSLNVFADDFYYAERNNTIGYGYWIGKIGLIYPSDFSYIYGYNASECNSTKNLYYCSDNKNWIINPQYNYGVETRTITPQPTNTSIYYVRTTGGITAGFAGPGEYGEMYYNVNIKPTLYLNNDIYINSGTGTKSEPYTIKQINQEENTDNNETNSKVTSTSNISTHNKQNIDNPETIDNINKYINILVFTIIILTIILNIKLKIIKR